MTTRKTPRYESLEDHAGDITKKARESEGYSIEKLAQHLDIDQITFEHFEKTGVAPKNLNIISLCQFLKLNYKAFESIMSGWMPTVNHEFLNKKVLMLPIKENGITSNSWVIKLQKSNKAITIDTGPSRSALANFLVTHKLELTHLLITHQHTDHIAGIATLKSVFKKLHIFNYSQLQNIDKDTWTTKPIIKLDELDIHGVCFPGHTRDSCLFLIRFGSDSETKFLFTGDTLFSGSIGEGFYSAQELRNNLNKIIFSLPDSTIICPGHGPISSIGQEKEHNPFFYY